MNPFKYIFKKLFSERERNAIWYKLHAIRSILYKGKKVYCPCCGGNFTKFLSYGDVEKRANALCPRCHSLERQRLLWFYLDNRTDFFKEKYRVLHFAPEPVLEKKFMHMDNIDYMSVDLNPALAMVEADIQQLPFEDETFDIVFCSHVLAMVEDDEKALQEIFRVLRKGGKAFIQERYDVEGPTVEDKTKATDADRKKVYGKTYLRRLYGHDLEQRIAAVGFEVDVTRYLDEFDEEQKQRFGLGNREEIFLSKKR